MTTTNTQGRGPLKKTVPTVRPGYDRYRQRSARICQVVFDDAKALAAAVRER
jgi:hypothetical protein